MAAAAEQVHQLGGTFVVNHPHSPGYPACTGCRWELGDRSAQYADALEVWNGPWDPRSQNAPALRLWDRWLNAGRRLPAVAGTDSHHPPRTPATLGFTFVWATPTVADILEAVRRGHSYLSCGPRFTWEQDRADALASESAPLRLEVERLREPAEVRLIAHGEVVATADAEPGRAGVIRFPMAGATSARWYRAELRRRGSNHLLALTNPVFTASERVPPAAVPR
jgi:hypothetical protein